MSAPRILVSGLPLAQPMGGVRRHALELWPRVARRLQDAGGSLAVLTPRGGLPVELDARLRAARVEFIESTRPALGPSHRWLHEGRELRRLATRFDVVHVGHLPLPRVERPTSWLIHDLRHLELTGERPSLRRLLARRALAMAAQRAAAVLTVSRTVADALAARFPGLVPRLRVAHNGCDHLPAATNPPPEALVAHGAGLPAPPYLLALGHVEARKNLGLLVEALALDPALPPLVVAGRPKGSAARALWALARDRGVDNRLTLRPGPRDDGELAALYGRAACVVVPSLVEGFGLAAAEAMPAGRPLAVADAGALPEIAAPGTPRFAPSDPRACAAAIQRALVQPPSALAAARAHARGFRWDDAATVFVRTFEELAERPSHP